MAIEVDRPLLKLRPRSARIEKFKRDLFLASAIGLLALTTLKVCNYRQYIGNGGIWVSASVDDTTSVTGGFIFTPHERFEIEWKTPFVNRTYLWKETENEIR